MSKLGSRREVFLALQLYQGVCCVSKEHEQCQGCRKKAEWVVEGKKETWTKCTDCVWDQHHKELFLFGPDAPQLFSIDQALDEPEFFPRSPWHACMPTVVKQLAKTMKPSYEFGNVQWVGFDGHGGVSLNGLRFVHEARFFYPSALRTVRSRLKRCATSGSKKNLFLEGFSPSKGVWFPSRYEDKVYDSKDTHLCLCARWSKNMERSPQKRSDKRARKERLPKASTLTSATTASEPGTSELLPTSPEP